MTDRFDETTIHCSCGGSITPCLGLLNRKRKIVSCHSCGQAIGLEVKRIDRKTVTLEPCNKAMKFFRIAIEDRPAAPYQEEIEEVNG